MDFVMFGDNTTALQCYSKDYINNIIINNIKLNTYYIV